MTEFSGLKAMVVEDEGSVALLIEDMLLGFEMLPLPGWPTPARWLEPRKWTSR